MYLYIYFVIGLVYIVVAQTHAHQNPKTNPYEFTYRRGQQLSVNLVLQNIPPDVTRSVVLSAPGYNAAMAEDNGVEYFRNGTEQHVFLTHKLFQSEIQIYIHLLITKTNSCVIKKIFKGKAMNETSIGNGKDTCLDLCSVLVDFRNECEVHAQIGAEESIEHRTVHPQFYIWYQTDYKYNVRSSAPSRLPRALSWLSFKPEHFDNNTYFISSVVTSSPVNLTYNNNTKTRVYIHANTTGDKYNVSASRYINSTGVEFSCRHLNDRHSDVQVGIINPAVDTMTASSTTEMTVTDDTLPNGTILCCVVYRETAKSKFMHIKREIHNKTLFIHTTRNETILHTWIMVTITITLLVVAGALVALVVVIRRRCLNNTNSQQTPPTGNDLDKVFYLNLLFRKQCQKEIEEIENHYEEIN